MEENIVDEAAIFLIEETLIEMEEEERLAMEFLGNMGANIMGMLEDGDELLNDDGVYWERVEVDVDGYRRMGDPSFSRHFRLSKPTFTLLLETLATYMLDTGKVIRIREPLEVPLLMTLWILANPDTFRSVALRFGVLPGTVHYHYSYIIMYLREMGPMFIKWPDAAERRAISARFEGYSGFPGVVGAIDGTHNVITAPNYQKDKYRNRYKSHSFNTMCVCDDNLLIRDYYIGEAGSLHDARVFRRSPLYRKIIENENNEYLDDGQHIIGDKAYPVMNCLMTPIRRHPNFTEQERAFNLSLCKSRVRIEHAFGKAFGQWRRMKMLHVANIDIAIDHIASCFVLHNFMILNGEKLIDLDDPTFLLEDHDDMEGNENENEEEDEDEDEENRGLNPEFSRLVRQAKAGGRQKRAELLNLF